MTIANHTEALAEIVQWNKADTVKPDADMTVMILAGGEVDAYPGWFDGEKWFFADATPCADVIYWADMLEGPLV